MIRAIEVDKSLGGRTVLSRVSFDLPAGGHLVVTGPSGCGKTTLLRLLAGLDQVDGGAIWLDGREVSHPHATLPPHLRSMGFAFQAPALWPHMSVRGHLSFAAGPRPDPAVLDDLVSGLGLRDLLRKVPHELSGGQARRVGLARAMIARPRRLLLDEAFSHLDTVARTALLDFVIDRADSWKTSLILVSHDAVEIERVRGHRLHLSAEGQP